MVMFDEFIPQRPQQADGPASPIVRAATVGAMDRRTRRHCRRLAHAMHTDRVDRALVRPGIDSLRAHLLETRLLRAGKHGQPLLRPGEGPGVRALLRRVLDAVATVYPREVATVIPLLDEAGDGRSP
jgi:hypothetical protein